MTYPALEQDRHEDAWLSLDAHSLLLPNQNRHQDQTTLEKSPLPLSAIITNNLFN